MNTVGQILKTARLNQKISLARLSDLTKIKKEFIQRIEENNWDKLPEFPVVSGFVKNIATTLDVSVNNANAILRRDYPPKKLSINPKPDVEGKFIWSPKITFAISVLMLILVVLGYLGFEYLKFIKPPDLRVLSPKENEIVLQLSVRVSGETTTDATLTVNNQPIILDQDGRFSSEVEINKDTKELTFVATSRSGKKSEIVRKIKVE